MTPETLKIIEIIRQGDIRSAMDQIKAVCEDVKQTQLQLTDLYSALESKINSNSRSLEGNTYITIVGSGTITTSTSSYVIIGTNTAFNSELEVGWSIKIGNDTHVIESITDNEHLTLASYPSSNMSQQLFGIIKPVTKEQLIGDFQFGAFNNPSAPFRGVINNGSSLEHYGRIAQPNDIINVNYMTKQLSPIARLAAKGISRFGDTINGSSYKYQNCKIDFDSRCSVTYRGGSSSEFNIAVIKNLTDLETAMRSDITCDTNNTITPTSQEHSYLNSLPLIGYMTFPCLLNGTESTLCYAWAIADSPALIEHQGGTGNYFLTLLLPVHFSKVLKIDHGLSNTSSEIAWNPSTYGPGLFPDTTQGSDDDFFTLLYAYTPNMENSKDAITIQIQSSVMIAYASGRVRGYISAWGIL